jgi:hypothetical protein
MWQGIIAGAKKKRWRMPDRDAVSPIAPAA